MTVARKMHLVSHTVRHYLAGLNFHPPLRGGQSNALGLLRVGSSRTAKTNYSLRNSLNIEVPRPRSEFGRSSFKHRAALAWNLLPHHVKECANLRLFKIKLKVNKHLLNSINFAKGSCCVSMKHDDFLYF